MSSGTTIALFAITSVNLVISAGTLALMFAGAKRVQRQMTEAKTQVEQARAKGNASLKSIRDALDKIEI